MKRRSYKNPYNIRGFKSAERKGPELFNFGPFMTEKAAGIEAKSRLRQHFLSMGDATEKISDVRKGRKLVGFRAPSASAWISPVRANVGRRRNIGDGTYEGHPSFKHWAASFAAMNEFQLYRALSDCPRSQAYAIFIKLHPRLKGAGLVTKKLAEYAWDELHADPRKNPRRNPAAFIRKGKKYVAFYDQMTEAEAERKAAELRSTGKKAMAGEVPGRGWGVYCVKNLKRNSGIKRIDVDANRWRDGNGNKEDALEARGDLGLPRGLVQIVSRNKIYEMGLKPSPSGPDWAKQYEIDALRPPRKNGSRYTARATSGRFWAGQSERFPWRRNPTLTRMELILLSQAAKRDRDYKTMALCDAAIEGNSAAMRQCGELFETKYLHRIEYK